MAMKLYSSPGSPNALRARAVAFELGLAPEIINVNIGAGENRLPEYLKLNPNGKVPTLVDGDVVIWESRAINAYLASVRPARGLDPADPAKRAMIDQWSYWQAIHLGPAMQRVHFERVQKQGFGRGDPDEASIAAELKQIAELLGILDQALEGKQWIIGGISIADFALATTFMLRKSAKLGVEAFPNVTAWIDRLELRPSWQRAVASWKETMAVRGIPTS
jgi:glutathione S-transferase